MNYTYVPKPKPKKITDIPKVIKYVKSLLINDKFISIKDIRTKTSKKFGIMYSNSFIYTLVVKKLNYSYKKITKKTYSKDINELMKKKKAFIKNIGNYKNIICIDETYVHSNIHDNYGWSPKGKRLIHFVKSNPKKYSVIVAISCNGIEQFMICEQNVNTSTYELFMTALCLNHKNKRFLMDNVSFHKSDVIKNIVTQSTNSILYILRERSEQARRPPYSPELNPIEEVFSIFKRNLIKLVDGTIVNKIKKTITGLLNTNFENYYKHSFQS